MTIVHTRACKVLPYKNYEKKHQKFYVFVLTFQNAKHCQKLAKIANKHSDDCDNMKKKNWFLKHYDYNAKYTNNCNINICNMYYAYYINNLYIYLKRSFILRYKSLICIWENRTF